VIVSDAGGLPEVIEHNRSGIVVPRGNPEALADAMTGLLRDPSHAARLAEAALRRVREEFNWDRIAASTKKVYETVWEAYQKCDW
jgi:glycosyltransferase involved in cell wall biosynthesis